MKEYTIDKYKELRKQMYKDRQTHIDEEGNYWAVGNMKNYTGAVKGIAIDKLAELEDEMENGTLIKLPCKVGDKVYFNTWVGGVNVGIQEHQVIGFNLSVISKRKQSVVSTELPISDFGKTVFLTKEEAEAKLKELKGEV